VACRPVATQRREISKSTTAVSNGFANKDVCKETIGNSNRGNVFSVRPVPRYKRKSWSNELVAGQSQVGKNVSMEAEELLESVTRQRLVKTKLTEKT
jgi:hypothetical protein